MAYTVVDLFCGCGGLSRGLGEAGFDVRAGFDNWEDAIAVYRENNPDHEARALDLSDEDATVEAVAPYRPFLIAGGPPCQDFSAAGGRSEGDRANLTVTYARVVRRVRPVCFIMENVPEAAKSAALKQAMEVFRGAGYGLTLKILNASLCGVPQLRKRMFLVGMLGARDDFLSDRLDAAMSDEPMTIRRYDPELVGFDYYYRHPRTYGRRAIFSVDEPSPTVRGVNRPKPPKYKRHAGDLCDPSDDRVKSLDFEQRARIQTFPKGWFDIGAKISNAAREQMIGNAVPVALARFVGDALHSFVAESREAERGARMEDAVEMTDRLVERLTEAFGAFPVDHPHLVRDIYRIISDLPPADDHDSSRVLAMLAVKSPAKRKPKPTPVEEPPAVVLEAAE